MAVLSHYRIFEVTTFGLAALYITTPLRISLLHANLTYLKMRICKSSLHCPVALVMPNLYFHCTTLLTFCGTAVTI